MTDPASQLDPLPKRLAIFAVLVMIAVASIWLIDQRAMQRQREMRQQYPSPTTAPQSVPRRQTP